MAGLLESLSELRSAVEVIGRSEFSEKDAERIDQRKIHRLACWPDCGGWLKQTGNTRVRYTEDIPEDLQPVATEHTIHRDWCPKWKRQVVPRVPDALPKCQLGVRTLCYSAWQHYATGVTLAQVRDVFNSHL